MLTNRKNPKYLSYGKLIAGISMLLLVVILVSFIIEYKDKSFEFISPYIIDSTANNADARNAIWMETGNYTVQYIGKRKDTIQLKYISLALKGYAKNKGRSKPEGVRIIVDTSKFVSSYAIFKGERNKTNFYKAYPVYIVNTTIDTLNIGYGAHLPLKLEAIDKFGNWRPIEETFSYFCGTGLNGIILPPNEIAVTSTPVYSGNFKTKLRITYSDIPSHTFNGSINLSQFESEFDERGESKPAPSL